LVSSWSKMRRAGLSAAVAVLLEPVVPVLVDDPLVDPAAPAPMLLPDPVVPLPVLPVDPLAPLPMLPAAPGVLPVEPLVELPLGWLALDPDDELPEVPGVPDVLLPLDCAMSEFGVVLLDDDVCAKVVAAPNIPMPATSAAESSFCFRNLSMVRISS
jgi:hypothetical protein